MRISNNDIQKQDRRQKMDQQSQFIGLHRTIHDAARQCYEKLTNISAAINLYDS